MFNKKQTIGKKTCLGVYIFRRKVEKRNDTSCYQGQKV